MSESSARERAAFEVRESTDLLADQTRQRARTVSFKRRFESSSGKDGHAAAPARLSLVILERRIALQLRGITPPPVALECKRERFRADESFEVDVLPWMGQ